MSKTQIIEVQNSNKQKLIENNLQKNFTYNRFDIFYKNDYLLFYLKNKLDEIYIPVHFEKKSAIRGLHANGYNVRQFKEHIKEINELSIPKVMVKRALIYAGIIGLFGLGIDLIKNHNNKQANSKQS